MSNPARKRAAEREFFIDSLLVRIHFIIVMIRWTGLAPWEFEFPFPGSLDGDAYSLRAGCAVCGSGFRVHRDTSLIRNRPLPRTTIGP